MHARAAGARAEGREGGREGGVRLKEAGAETENWK